MQIYLSRFYTGVISGCCADKLPSSSYLPPVDSYGAPSADPIAGYGDLDTAASEMNENNMNLKMLMNAVPGVPGEDYPIYSEVPDTDFSCDGKVAGGKLQISNVIR